MAAGWEKECKCKCGSKRTNTTDTANLREQRRNYMRECEHAQQDHPAPKAFFRYVC